MSKVLTQERLKELVHYNPETGVFTCLKKNNFRNVGDTVGTLNGSGYLIYGIESKHYYLHRLAWLYMEGKYPECIDHKNCNRADNRWCNLREVSQKENCYNRKIQTRSKTGTKGLIFDTTSGTYPRYTASIQVNGKRITKTLSLSGRVASEVIAELTAWLESARKELHGECTNHG